MDLTSFAGVPHTGATHRSTNACIAAIRASKSTPRGVDALLKHAMVGIPPWLNAPNVGLAALIKTSLGNVEADVSGCCARKKRRSSARASADGDRTFVVGRHLMNVSGEPDNAELDKPLALEYGERRFGARGGDMQGKNVKVRSSEGGEFDCYLATPRTGAKVPAIVIASAVHGVNSD